MKRNKLINLIKKSICIGLLSLSILTCIPLNKAGAVTNGVPSILLDYSHRDSTFDRGSSYNGNYESDIANEITKMVGEKLKSFGVHVKYTRSIDGIISITDRVVSANKDKNRDYYLSIHLNSTELHNGATGAESFDVGSNNISKNILEKLDSELGLVNRGNKESKYYNRNISGLSGIVELGFIDNKKDVDKIQSNKKLICDIIVNSILKEYGVNINDGAINVSQIYRVYNSNNVQQSAFKSLNGAKSVCKKGYYIQDNAKNIIYSNK